MYRREMVGMWLARRRPNVTPFSTDAIASCGQTAVNCRQCRSCLRHSGLTMSAVDGRLQPLAQHSVTIRYEASWRTWSLRSQDDMLFTVIGTVSHSVWRL